MRSFQSIGDRRPAGNQPVNEWGNHTELLEDDGSADFAELHARASLAPVLTGE